MSEICPRSLEVAQQFEMKWRDDDTCNYCGSLNPDLLMQHLEAGTAILGPTDKNYKVYVDIGERKTKFYFQHFNPEQKARFVQLLNEKKLNLGAPGYFYRLPFFVYVKENGEQNA